MIIELKQKEIFIVSGSYEEVPELMLTPSCFRARRRCCEIFTVLLGIISMSNPLFAWIYFISQKEVIRHANLGEPGFDIVGPVFTKMTTMQKADGSGSGPRRSRRLMDLAP